MIDLAETDMFVSQILALTEDPWKEPRLIKGENHDMELAEIALQLQDLPGRKLSDAEEDAERARMRADRDRLAELNKSARPDRWDDVEICSICDCDYRPECETAGHPKVTVGQHWASLDYAGQREMVVEYVKIYAESPDPELRKISRYPKLRIASRLFRLPRQWAGGTPPNQSSAPKTAGHPIHGWPAVRLPGLPSG